MPNQTMVYSCSAPEQEYTMAWPGILLHLLISSLKIRFCEQSVFAKSPLPHVYLISKSMKMRGDGKGGGGHSRVEKVGLVCMNALPAPPT